MTGSFLHVDLNFHMWKPLTLRNSTMRSIINAKYHLQGGYSFWWLWQSSKRNHIQAPRGRPEPAQLSRTAGSRCETAHLQQDSPGMDIWGHSSYPTHNYLGAHQSPRVWWPVDGLTVCNPATWCRLWAIVCWPCQWWRQNSQLVAQSRFLPHILIFCQWTQNV